MSQSNKLPQSFPYSPKECKVVTESFFECFTNSSIKENANDSEAGNRGLSKCMKEMKNYQDCMELLEKKKPPKLMRVLCFLFMLLIYKLYFF